MRPEPVTDRIRSRVREAATESLFGPDGLVAFVETNEYDVATIVVKRLPEAVR